MSQPVGTIAIDGNMIVVESKPHVALQFRRMFVGAERVKACRFALAATPERAYDVRWFSTRYPLIVDGASEARFADLVAQHQRKLDAIAALDDDDYVPREFDLALPPREYQRRAADLLIRAGSLLIADEVGLGKQQPVDALVFTPSGQQRIGDLIVGDLVIGTDGRATAVTGVHPQGIKPSYRVRFSDGSSVEAGPDHLWAFDYRVGGRRWGRIVVTTEQLRTGADVVHSWVGHQPTVMSLDRTTLYLPMLRAPIEYADPPALPADPYLIGQLIANASLAHGSPQLVSNAADWPEVRETLLSRGATLGSERRYGNSIHVITTGMVGIVRNLALNVLSGVKRIPLMYLHASTTDRIALFHGLMDCDGSISKTGNRVTYHTTSPGLAQDVRALVEQLGGIASIGRYERDDGEVNFVVRIRLPSWVPPFTVTRKLSRYTGGRRPTRTFVGVEYVRDVESVCISVAAPDHLYATEHAILTHNTCTAICALASAGALPALVVTMTHLTRQWEREIGRFAPRLRVHRIRKGEPYAFTDIRVEVDPLTDRRKVVRHKGVPDVILINYHKLHGWADTLAGIVRTVIFDEAQELRHSGTHKYTAARAIAEAADMRCGLTATPIYNYGVEIYNVMDVVAPTQLGTPKEFLDSWCGGGGDGEERQVRDGKAAVSDPAALGTYLRETGLMIRRTRKDVNRELPALTIVRHVVECDPESIERATADVAELARRVLERIGSPLDQMRAAGEIDYKLRQATGIAKAGPVAEFVRLLVESGERVVLYGWHHEVYSLWQSHLDRGVKIPYVTYTGKQTDRQKDEARAKFIEGDARVMIISLRAGQGLDGLQHVCRTCVIGELDWSPAVIHQDMGRLHRDGQKDPVMAYALVAEEGSDPVIEDVLGIKMAQSSWMLNPADGVGDAIQTGAAADHIRRLAESVLARTQAR